MNAHVKEAGKLILDTHNFLDADGNDRSNRLAAYQFENADQLLDTATRHTWVKRNSTNDFVKGKDYTPKMAAQDFNSRKNQDNKGLISYAY